MFGAVVPRLTARFGYRITAIAGALLLAISICASSFVDNFWLFFLLFSILSGLGSSASYHCSILVVLRHFVKWRYLVVGIMASTSSVGMFVISQITEVLLSNYGFKNALRGWAMLFFCTAPLACFYDSRSKERGDGIDQWSEHKSEQHDEIIPASHLLRNARFIVYLTSVSLVFFVVFTPSIFLVRHAAHCSSTCIRQGLNGTVTLILQF